MHQHLMSLFGANEQVLLHASQHKHLSLCRVTEHHKDRYVILNQEGFFEAKVSGKWMYQTSNPKDFPTVGDFVLAEEKQDLFIIHDIIPRTSVLERKVAGLTSDTQLIATNIDYIVICQSMNENFNTRRLERYLALSWSSGATPIILLTKKDLSQDPESFIYQAKSVSIGVDIITCTDQQEDGFKELESIFIPHKTYVFIGSSGVGKSTVVNHLLKQEKLLTQETGNHAKGRHTTTSRTLFLTKEGSIVIDTPGMRELQLDSADMDTTFEDITELAKSCKFNDCTHEKEPGCAVREHIEQGYLDIHRYHNYQKMKKELKYIEQRQNYLERQRNKSKHKKM
jgi:ribosome biogenesis GTPase